MGIILIVLAGLCLRLICIDKAEGLWNDEYISWLTASQPFTKTFWQSVMSQCHMPFYYIYLKFFMKIFGQSDLLLRLTSVFAGVISIIAMYFTGLEKDKKTALLAAGFTAISGFLIYYSQEVRIYSVLFLFSALSLLFTLKTAKNPDAKNIAGLIISDILILFTHTIGFVYVFFNLLYISFALFKQLKKYIIILWVSVAIAGCAGLPLLIKIFSTHSFSQWWGSFSIAKLGFLITDYLSPYLTNLVNAPDKFFYNVTAGFVIFGLVPSIIAIFWICRAIKSSTQNRYLIGIAGSVIFVLMLAALSGKLVFITKYSIEIYPILLFLAACGASEIKNKKLSVSLISIYCLLCIVYNFVSPVAAPKIKRAQGHKIAADLIERAELSDGDYIILEYYPKERFKKYADFSKYNVISIDKGNFTDYLSMNMNYEKAYKNGKNIYRQTFMASNNLYFAEKLNEEIISKLKPEQSVLVIMLNGVSFYSPNDMKKIVDNDLFYEKTPLLYLVFSHVKEQVFSTLSESLSVSRFESRGDWSAIKFTKLNKTGNN